jgi:hypothetical protein
MTVSGRFAIVPSTGVSAATALRAYVQKPSKALDSRQNRGSRDSSGDRRRGDRRGCDPSRNDTTGDASFWNGPRLRAPFVAQVIGQATGGQAPDTRSALTSYAQIEPWHFLLDRSV